MRSLFTFVSFVFMTNLIFAQKIELKIYQNSDFYHRNHYDNASQSYVWSSNASFIRISLAIALQTKKKLIHELELFIPKMNDGTNNLSMPMNYYLNDVGPNMIRKSDAYSFRYQMTKVWPLRKNLTVTFGAAINPFYIKTNYTPLVVNSYPRDRFAYGASLNFVPGIRYSLSQKFAVELSMPFKIYDYQYNGQRIENPAIRISQQRNGSWSGTFFENAYNVRLGIAYKL